MTENKQQFLERVSDMFGPLPSCGAGLLGSRSKSVEDILAKPKEDIVIARSVVEGPKCAKLGSFLKDEAFMLALDIELDVDRGWFRETVRYKVTGLRSKVLTFSDRVRASLKAYYND